MSFHVPTDVHRRLLDAPTLVRSTYLACADGRRLFGLDVRLSRRNWYICYIACMDALRCVLMNRNHVWASVAPRDVDAFVRVLAENGMIAQRFDSCWCIRFEVALTGVDESGMLMLDHDARDLGLSLDQLLPSDSDVGVVDDGV
jgi:hypothetical protein